MDPVSSVSGIPVAQTVREAVTPAGARSTFGTILKDQLAEVNQAQINADDAVKLLATGESANVHETVMSVVEADLSLRMIIEIRNRLIESYQEIMRMQI